MLRYVCKNPECLHTFLSPDLDKKRTCEICGSLLIYVGNPDIKLTEDDYRFTLTLEELKKHYVKLTKRLFREGITDSECLIRGCAIRKLSFTSRETLLKENGLWNTDSNIVYKMVKGKNELWKMVKDGKASRNQKRRKKIEKENGK